MSEEEDKSIDNQQEKILNEIITKGPNDLNIKLKIPIDEFHDEYELGDIKNLSSEGNTSNTKDDNKLKNKFGYSFNVEGFESNSVAYFNEILLGNKNKSNCFRVNFNCSDIIKLDKSTSSFCKKMINEKFELIGDIE